MSRSVTEVLLAPQQPERRPIHNYIDHFEAYQLHTHKSKLHLYYYFLVNLGVTLAFHAYLLVVQAKTIIALEMLYYLPFFIWFKLLLQYRRQFSVKDPHILNEKRFIEIYQSKFDIFNFFTLSFIFLLAIFSALHVFVGESGQILMIADYVTLLLSERVILQTKSLEQRLKSTLVCFRSQQTYYLRDYTFGQMKQPLQIEYQQKDKQFNPTSGQLFSTNFKKQKQPNRFQNSICSFEEHHIYSH